ncbi:unnamed protein product [Dicrocoelium dendriticum]|nr:unnamed protein product [Dicrocoelium dendriticum]
MRQSACELTTPTKLQKVTESRLLLTAFPSNSNFTLHEIQVFDNSLIEKSRTLNKGDRICVYGHLTAFPMSTADKFWVYCIVARSISAFVNPVRCSDDFTATTTSDPTPLEPSAAQSM